MLTVDFYRPKLYFWHKLKAHLHGSNLCTLVKKNQYCVLSFKALYDYILETCVMAPLGHANKVNIRFLVLLCIFYWLSLRIRKLALID